MFQCPEGQWISLRPPEALCRSKSKKGQRGSGFHSHSYDILSPWKMEGHLSLSHDQLLTPVTRYPLVNLLGKALRDAIPAGPLTKGQLRLLNPQQIPGSFGTRQLQEGAPEVDALGRCHDKLAFPLRRRQPARPPCTERFTDAPPATIAPTLQTHPSSPPQPPSPVHEVQ